MVGFCASLAVSGAVEALFKCRSALLEGVTGGSAFRADLRFGRACFGVMLLKLIALHACIDMRVLLLRDVVRRDPGVKQGDSVLK